MNEYLFNLNIVIIASVLCAFACFAFFKRIFACSSRKSFIIHVLVGWALFAVEVLALDSTFGLQQTPAGGYYILFVADIVLAFTLYAVRNIRSFLYGLGALLSCILLLAVTVNDYYQYFPTISSVFTGTLARPESTATMVAPHARTAPQISSIEQTMYGHGTSNGTIQTVTIPGTVSHLQARSSYIYLPPSYMDAALKNTQYPALVLLTGTPGTPSSWLQGNLFIHAMNSFASHHQGITPIVIITDHSGSFTNDTECVDSPHGNADTYLTVDVPTYIEQHYRVSTDPAHWGIGGFSEGGMCAAMLTLEHQNIFHHFLDIAGDPFPYLNNTEQTLPVLFHGSRTAQKEHNINWLLQNAPLSSGLTAQFGIGANDNKRLITELRYSYNLASQHKIPSSYESVAHRAHDFTAWFTAYHDALPLMSYYLGATECETGCGPQT